MENSATVKIQRSAAPWWTVSITGRSNDATMAVIKAATKVPEEGFRVFYEAEPMRRWLEV